MDYPQKISLLKFFFMFVNLILGPVNQPHKWRASEVRGTAVIILKAELDERCK